MPRILPVCCLCSLPYKEQGHNAHPLAIGLCCDMCNTKVNREQENSQSEDRNKFLNPLATYVQPMYTCSICQGSFYGHGNNAMPLEEGVCCDSCNSSVIKARLSAPAIRMVTFARNTEPDHSSSSTSSTNSLFLSSYSSPLTPPTSTPSSPNESYSEADPEVVSEINPEAD